MLNIQVLGKGMIPRGLGLAPRKEFFKADLILITTILATPGLKVNMLTQDNKVVEVTRANVKNLWDKHRLDKINPVKNTEVVDEKTEVVTTDDVKENIKDSKSVEDNKPAPAIEEAKEVVEEVKETAVPVEEVKDESKEEVKPENQPIKPIINDNNGKNNKNNHYKK